MDENNCGIHLLRFVSNIYAFAKLLILGSLHDVSVYFFQISVESRWTKYLKIIVGL